MIISINKTLDKYDGSEYTRPSPSEYQFEFRYKESIFNYDIDISESKKQSIPERNIPISAFIDEDDKNIDVTIESSESWYPYLLEETLKKQDILNLIDQEKRENNDKKIRLNVASEFPNLLEINWELLFKKIFGEDILVINKRTLTFGEKNQLNESNSLNTLMLLSYAYGDHEKIFDDFSLESQKILGSYFSNLMRDKEKPNIFTIARYINRNSIKHLHFEDYNILHISAHGQPRKIGFESQHNSDDIDWLEPNDFSLLCCPDHKYEVIFLAICNGANNIENLGSTASELIKVGITSTVVAFRDGAGSEVSIPTFIESFYEFLLRNISPEIAFEESVTRIKKNEKVFRLLPVYYSR